MDKEPARSLREAASNAGLFLDFDGTLSEIVHLPSEARPIPGAPEVLERLAEVFRLVAVVSGRSAHQLLEWLGPGIEIWGVHGAERTIEGHVVLSERARAFSDLMRRVHAEAAEAIARIDMDGIVLEDKGVMIGLHFRAADDVKQASQALDRVAGELAERHGLLRAGGRLAFELRPPVEFSKATVVLERSRELALDAAAFVGDDKVDLPGFDALDILRDEGRRTVRVAVDSAEAPPALIERADVIVDGPAGALRWLEGLVET